jgi:hypothetical protein
MTKHSVAHPDGVASPRRDRGRILRPLLFRMGRRRHGTRSACSPETGLREKLMCNELERKMTRKSLVTVVIPV